MEGVFEILYKQFFLRDVLGKVAPGFMIIFALSRIFGMNLMALVPSGNLAGPWLLIFYLIIIPVCYMAGVGLQIGSEFVGLHSASPHPVRILVFHQSQEMRDALDEHKERLAMINTIGDDRIRADIKSQRERFVYLKEGSGNFAVALVIVAISLFFQPPAIIPEPLRLRFILLLLVGAVLLLISHYLHSARQASFEIRALRQVGILTDSSTISKMSEKIPVWTGERPR